MPPLLQRSSSPAAYCVVGLGARWWAYACASVRGCRSASIFGKGSPARGRSCRTSCGTSAGCARRARRRRAAARMVLPTRLRSKVLTELSASTCAAPSPNSSRTVSRPRPSGWFWSECSASSQAAARPHDWRRGVQPHHKPPPRRDEGIRRDEGRRELRGRVARRDRGLTSDDVHRKGSLAVQAMLRWLEVARLTRNSGAVEKQKASLSSNASRRAVGEGLRRCGRVARLWSQRAGSCSGAREVDSASRRSVK